MNMTTHWLAAAVLMTGLLVAGCADAQYTDEGEMEMNGQLIERTFDVKPAVTETATFAMG